MTTLTSIQLDFYKMRDSMKSNINSVLHEETTSLLSDFQSRAPVDTGLYRSNWKLFRGRFSSSNTLASVTLSNKTPYAHLMEFGAPRNSPPWFFPESGSRTGRLVEANGRIWAGGMRPGHDKTIGGAIDPILVKNNERLNRITNNIANGIMGKFK